MTTDYVNHAAKLREIAEQPNEKVFFFVDSLCAAADEIEVMRACFNTASRGMSHKEVFDLISETKKLYVARRAAAVAAVAN